MKKSARVGLLVAGVCVGAVVGATVFGIIRPGFTSSAQATEPSEVVTVPVEMGTLTDKLKLNATLSYGSPVQLPAASGVITALPASGTVVKVGSTLYEVEGKPVVLLRGNRPFWRDLTADMSSGPDVKQLEQNLAALGYFTREPDTRFDWWTTDAINRWQKDRKQTVNGTVRAADIVAVNAPSVRVDQVSAKLGDSGASPLTVTSTTIQAQATITAAQAKKLEAGTKVSVRLPDNTEVKAKISAVEPGGKPGAKEGETTKPAAVIEFADQKPIEKAGLGSAKVTVEDGETTDPSLIVPATALLATAQDTYAVEVKTAEGIVRVPVEVGLIADAKVQIVASGPEVEGAASDAPSLSEGDEVVLAE